MSKHHDNKRALSSGRLRYDHVTALVTAYQRDRGLEVTGVADDATIAALDVDSKLMIEAEAPAPTVAAEPAPAEEPTAPSEPTP